MDTELTSVLGSQERLWDPQSWVQSQSGLGLGQPDPNRFAKYYTDDILIRTAYPGDISYVAHNLRAQNLEEIWATRWDEPDAAGVQAFTNDMVRIAGAMVFCVVSSAASPLRPLRDCPGMAQGVGRVCFWNS